MKRTIKKYFCEKEEVCIRNIDCCYFDIGINHGGFRR